MLFIEVFFIALGLAADAFAVSVCVGSVGALRDTRSMVRLSFHFGLFQFLMPILGWLGGMNIEPYIRSFDHWAAFALLSWVAIHMIQSARSGDNSFAQTDPSKGARLVILSVSTSLDALAIGMSLALLQVSVWYPAVVIGVVTGVTSFIGIILGRRFSGKIGRRATVIGGVVLILIGAKILLTHILSF